MYLVSSGGIKERRCISEGQHGGVGGDPGR